MLSDIFSKSVSFKLALIWPTLEAVVKESVSTKIMGIVSKTPSSKSSMDASGRSPPVKTIPERRGYAVDSEEKEREWLSFVGGGSTNVW